MSFIMTEHSSIVPSALTNIFIATKLTWKFN